MSQLTKVCLLMAVVLAGEQTAAAQSPWIRHVIDNSLRGADGVRLADFNHDGLPDITTGWEESGTIRLYLHPGIANVGQPWPGVTLAEAASPEDAVPWDVDGDGRWEVVSCHEGKQRQVLIHRFHGELGNDTLLNPQQWSSESIEQLDGAQWMFAEPIQLGDRQPALVVGAKGSQGAIMLLVPQPNTAGQGSGWEVKRLREAGWIMSLVAIDIDEDGDLDIVYSDRKGPKRQVGWLEQPSAGDVDTSEWIDHSIGGQALEVMFLDVHPQQILAATREAEILEFQKTTEGAWHSRQIANPAHVRFGKSVRKLTDGTIWLSANTAADSAAGDAAALWYKPLGEDWQAIDRTTRMKTDLVVPIDIDQDGDLDLLTCEERRNLGIIWYENPQ